MTAQHGTTTTSSIGWYGSYSDESGDYCEPFDQELYESQLRHFILVGSTGKPSRLFSESQHPCGSASFVYSRKHEAVVIPDYHAGYINEADSGRVRPKTKYTLEFELQGLTDDFYGANATIDSKYKITNTIINRKPVYKKLFEDWFIFFDQDRLRYVLANGLIDYNNFLVGEIQRPNGIYRSLLDDDQIGISEGVEEFAEKTTCEVDIQYQVRTVSGAYFPKKYKEYFETSEIKGSANRTISENTHLASSCFLDVKKLELSTEIGRGFGSTVSPKFTQEFETDCTNSGTLKISYEADVDPNCDVTAVEIEHINEGERIVNLVERYDANYTTTSLSVDEVVNNKTMYLGDNPPTITQNSNGQKSFLFDGTNCFKISSLYAQNAVNNEEFSIFLKYKPATESQTGVLMSRWQINEASTINLKSTHLVYTHKLQTYKNTNIYSLDKPTKDVWHNLLITYNQSTTTDNLQIYLDDQTAIPFDTTSEEFKDSDLPFVIGGFLSNNGTLKNGYIGEINDIRFYDRQLTIEEKQQLFSGIDYDSTRQTYNIPETFNKTEYEHLFYENTETLVSETDFSLPVDIQIKEMHSIDDITAISYMENDKLQLEFFHDGTSSYKRTTAYPEATKFKITSDKIFVCYTNHLFILNLNKSESGAVSGISSFTELTSYIHNDFFDVSASGKFVFVTRYIDGEKIATSYLLTGSTLTPVSFSGDISNVTDFCTLDEFVLITLSGKTMILYKELDDIYEIKWLQDIQEPETIIKSKIISCVQDEKTKYFIASRYETNDLRSYSSRFKSSTYIKNNVGILKLRKINESLTKINGYEIEETPFQVICPPYDVHGNGFLNTKMFGDQLGFYDNFLVVATPGYKSWCYQLTSDSQYVFVTALKSLTIDGSFVNSLKNSILINTKTIGNEAAFFNNRDKLGSFSFTSKSNSELLLHKQTKLPFTEYGQKLKTWFRFGDDYVNNDEKFVMLDRSGNYNHLNCYFKNSDNTFVSPFDNRFVGPTEGDSSIFLSGNTRMDFSCSLENKSFSINVWYMPTQLNTGTEYNVVISSKYEASDTETGFCILADGRTKSGDTILEPTPSVTNVYEWVMVTVCYNHEAKRLNHYVNSIPSVWYDDVDISLDDDIFRIGREFETNDTNGYIGYLDDIKIYDTLLTPTEIQSEYKKSWKYEWLQ